MVIPRSRSDFSLSRTHAYLKEPLPSSAASYGGCQLSVSDGMVCVAMLPRRDGRPCQARAAHILIANLRRGRGVVAGQRDVPSQQGDSVPK